MAFFRPDAGAFTGLTVEELRALLDEAFPPTAPQRGRYVLYPNELGNLAFASHRIEGPEGPGQYYLGFLDLAARRVRWAAKEGEFPANSFLRHSGEVQNGNNDAANGPEGVALIKPHGGD